MDFSIKIRIYLRELLEKVFTINSLNFDLAAVLNKLLKMLQQPYSSFPLFLSSPLSLSTPDAEPSPSSPPFPAPPRRSTASASPAAGDLPSQTGLPNVDIPPSTNLGE
jgi:hypothetical protein